MLLLSLLRTCDTSTKAPRLAAIRSSEAAASHVRRSAVVRLKPDLCKKRPNVIAPPASEDRPVTRLMTVAAVLLMTSLASAQTSQVGSNEPVVVVTGEGLVHAT